MTPHRWLKGRLSILVLLLACLICMPSAVLAADVDVYAEGAYTATDLVIYLYADINSGPILSFGVKVEYPAGLTFVSATKNKDVWYFGDGGEDYTYMDPSDDGSGVVIIGGKLDTADPTAGVAGTRVLLGTVTFTHSGVTDFSGVNMTYAHGTGDQTDPSNSYKNFVDTDGVVKDGGGVSFNLAIMEAGDANADGNINSADAQIVAQIFFGNHHWTVFGDCNGDGDVNSADAGCISQKFFNQ